MVHSKLQRRELLALLLLLAGCPSADKGDNITDMDGDGYTSELDCDDADAAIGPPTTWYLDADGDGYGSGDTTTACTSPAGYAAAGEDCDATDPATYPGADEACDGKDNDCDAEVDEDGLQTWYADEDGDGYGDALQSEVGCAAPSGYIADATDCDDANAEVSPSTVELPYDGVDNDCDPTTLDDDLDEDGVGVAEDCDDLDARVSPLQEEICFNGLDDDCDAEGCPGESDISLSSATYVLVGEANDDHLVAGKARGDIDGDGALDIAVGATGSDRAGAEAGAAFLFSGPLEGAASLGDARSVLLGASANDTLGGPLSIVPDLDGDGYDELIVGATGVDSGAGAVYLFLGPITADLAVSSADLVMRGVAADGGAGAFDLRVDPDGVEDPMLVVGAHNNALNPNTAATAWTVTLDLSGASDANLDDIATATIVDAGNTYLGDAVALVGDLDGDGVGEVALGSPLASPTGANAGAVYLYPQSLSGSWTPEDADIIISGAALDRVGVALAASEEGASGYPTLAVGTNASDEAGVDSGGAYLFDDLHAGAVSLADASIIIRGAAANEVLGDSLAWVGDTDGDGVTELAIGAPGAEAYTGALFLVNLGILSGTIDLATDPSTRLLGEAEGEVNYWTPGAVGDVNQDGLDDVLLTSATARGGDSAAWLYFGGGF